MIIKNGLVFTENCIFEKLTIETEGACIRNVGTFSETSSEVIDAEGCYIIPGLTDIHFHGCIGYDFCDGTSEAITNMISYETANGITTLCPATMTLPYETLVSVCQNAAQYVTQISSYNCTGTPELDTNKSPEGW